MSNKRISELPDKPFSESGVNDYLVIDNPAEGVSYRVGIHAIKEGIDINQLNLATLTTAVTNNTNVNITQSNDITSLKMARLNNTRVEYFRSARTLILGGNTSADTYSVAVGYGVQVGGKYSVGSGYATSLMSDYSVGIGYGCSASQVKSVVIGHLCYTSKPRTVNIGDNAKSYGDDAISIGTYSNVSAFDGMAIGNRARSTGNYGVAIGSNAYSSAYRRIRLGDTSARVETEQSIIITSDERDKTDIKDITQGLETINKLRPVEYRANRRIDYVNPSPADELAPDPYTNYNKDEHAKATKKSKRVFVGLISQEVDKVLPANKYNIVGDDHYNTKGEGRMHLSYDSFIPILIKSVQELSKKVDTLESQLAKPKTSKPKTTKPKASKPKTSEPKGDK